VDRVCGVEPQRTRKQPKLASYGRAQVSSGRPQSPPTAYRNGLAVGGGGGLDSANRRVSRTEMDFEQALRGTGTVVIREGLDMSKLGQTPDSPARQLPATPQSASPLFSRSSAQPNTPTVIPPTPTPHPSSSRMPSHDDGRGVFDDNNDRNNLSRRSMYRSPGTASSPDLATLLKKAKDKGAALPFLSKDKRSEEPPPLPTLDSRAGGRKRSSTSFGQSQSPPVTPLHKGKNKAGMSTMDSSDSSWTLANASPENGTVKVSRIFVFIRTFYNSLNGPSSLPNHLSEQRRAPSSARCSALERPENDPCVPSVCPSFHPSPHLFPTENRRQHTDHAVDLKGAGFLFRIHPTRPPFTNRVSAADPDRLSYR
jgi:hypothetical protein